MWESKKTRWKCPDVRVRFIVKVWAGSRAATQVSWNWWTVRPFPSLQCGVIRRFSEHVSSVLFCKSSEGVSMFWVLIFALQSGPFLSAGQGHSIICNWALGLPLATLAASSNYLPIGEEEREEEVKAWWPWPAKEILFTSLLLSAASTSAWANCRVSTKGKKENSTNTNRVKWTNNANSSVNYS